MSDAVSEASRQCMELGSKSFAAATRLFAPATRDSARLFYIWCRYCDDVVDGQVAGFGRREQAEPPAERLRALEVRTRSALAGERQSEVAFQALARVARQHAIPDSLPLAILDGFRMDVEGRTYRTVDDLMIYCYGVAGAIGVTMALIMGVKPQSHTVLDRACDLGIGFQLTNIARDVMDDAQAGRVYLPATLFAGVAPTPAYILDGGNRRAVLEATQALLNLAERYYASVPVGIAGLPWRSAWAVATAREIYRHIGRRVRRAENPWATRQSVPGWRKLCYTAAAVAAPMSYRLLGDPPRRGLWTRPQQSQCGLDLDACLPLGSIGTSLPEVAR